MESHSPSLDPPRVHKTIVLGIVLKVLDHHFAYSWRPGSPFTPEAPSDLINQRIWKQRRRTPIFLTVLQDPMSSIWIPQKPGIAVDRASGRQVSLADLGSGSLEWRAPRDPAFASAATTGPEFVVGAGSFEKGPELVFIVSCRGICHENFSGFDKGMGLEASL